MSGGNKHFEKLVAAGNPVGEVIAVEKFLGESSRLAALCRPRLNNV